MSFVVDTTILIDHLRGRPEAREWLLNHQTDGLTISVIARAEVLFRKSHGMLLPDALIAGTARAHDKTLVTLNSRDFPMDDIRVTRPY